MLERLCVSVLMEIYESYSLKSCLGAEDWSTHMSDRNWFFNKIHTFITISNQFNFDIFFTVFPIPKNELFPIIASHNDMNSLLNTLFEYSK